MLTITTGDAIRGWVLKDFKVGAGNLSHMCNPEDIVCIDADGDELLAILQKFQNIPMFSYNGDPITWYGDIAKFIVGNLTL